MEEFLPNTGRKDMIGDTINIIPGSPEITEETKIKCRETMEKLNKIFEHWRHQNTIPLENNDET